MIISAENTGNVTGTFRFKFEVQKRNAVGIFSTVDGFTQTENREKYRPGRRLFTGPRKNQKPIE